MSVARKAAAKESTKTAMTTYSAIIALRPAGPLQDSRLLAAAAVLLSTRREPTYKAAVRAPASDSRIVVG